MSTITKPFMYLVFVLAFVFFLDLVLLQVDINKTEMVLNEATQIVSKYEGDLSKINSELETLSDRYNDVYMIDATTSSGDDFLDGTRVVIQKEHKYISKNKTIKISKSDVILNKQI